jgi:uncharacterized protein YaeQ
LAIKATIFKAELQVSDLDRGHFATHALTLARHPSETDERMMVRLLAFALNADEALEFGRGLSAEDEPDLVRRDLTGAIELWIDVGLPDEREVRKASGRARRGQGLHLRRPWRRALVGAESRRPRRLANLTVVDMPEEAIDAIGAMAARTMRLDCTIQEGQLYFSGDAGTFHFEPRILAAPG